MGCILLTGGFGYIGSHTATILSEKNIDFVIYDNFSNSKKSVIERLENITKNKVKYEIGDIRDKNNLVKIAIVLHLSTNPLCLLSFIVTLADILSWWT